jgi:hypothetical protein
MCLTVFALRFSEALIPLRVGLCASYVVIYVKRLGTIFGCRLVINKIKLIVLLT